MGEKLKQVELGCGEVGEASGVQDLRRRLCQSRALKPHPAHPLLHLGKVLTVVKEDVLR